MIHKDSTRMKYRTLGKTRREVSVLAYGGSSLGGVFRKIDEGEAIRSVHVALDNGINLIDTAPYYGATRAESVLGKALKGIRRERYAFTLHKHASPARRQGVEGNSP